MRRRELHVLPNLMENVGMKLVQDHVEQLLT
jgi:hypothetical protein